MTRQDELVSAWLRYNESPSEEADVNDPDWWAVDEMMEMVSEDVETAWTNFVRLVKGADTEWQITMLGCGLLEDFLIFGNRGEEMMDRLEEEAKTDRRFVEVAAHVWSYGSAVWPRVDALLREYDTPRR